MPFRHKLPFHPPYPNDCTWSQIRISLEKPSAVILADAPVIEIVRSSNPQDEDTKRLYNEWTRSAHSNDLNKGRVPFPLQGKLSTWIKENYPGDTT